MKNTYCFSFFCFDRKFLNIEDTPFTNCRQISARLSWITHSCLANGLCANFTKDSLKTHPVLIWLNKYQGIWYNELKTVLFFLKVITLFAEVFIFLASHTIQNVLTTQPLSNLELSAFLWKLCLIIQLFNLIHLNFALILKNKKHILVLLQSGSWNLCKQHA